MTFVQDMFSLSGQTALVTGARTGIGQSIAVAFAAAGAKVVLVGHQDNMHETEGLVRQAGGTSVTYLMDLAQVEAIDDGVEQILSQTDVDILVNNAGIIRRNPATSYSVEDWDSVLNTNLNAVFRLTQKLAQPMLERHAGKIINIASLLSFQGGILVPAYTASKHAIAGLTKAWANEWAGSNVQVNAIAPGYIATNNTVNLRNDPKRSNDILNRIPAGRWGNPTDLQGAALFLASSASNYVSGHVLVVDGGWMAR